jgi:hypothetical protein
MTKNENNKGSAAEVIGSICIRDEKEDSNTITTSGGIVGSEDFGETINRHRETGNGPNANDLSSTTEKKDSRSYAAVARGTKRFVRPE